MCSRVGSDSAWQSWASRVAVGVGVVVVLMADQRIMFY